MADCTGSPQTLYPFIHYAALTENNYQLQLLKSWSFSVENPSDLLL